MSDVLKIKPKKYCTKCMNTGLDINNNPCDCQFRAETIYETVSCMDIPEQYRGIIFNKYLLPKDVPESYGDYMTELHDGIVSQRLRHKNVCICSPVAHGKTVFAYSCIEQLFRVGIPTFPVYDALEIKRIMLDTDLCRKQLHDVANPELLNTVPYLFVKVPRVATWEVFDALSTLVDRRVRRSVCTFLLFGGTWEQLIKRDSYGILSGLQGDGTYNTLEVKSWFASSNTTDHVVQLEENIG